MFKCPLTLALLTAATFSTASSAASHPLYKSVKNDDQMPLKNELIVAYYGRPGG